MKVARFVLKVVALALTTAAAVCCVIAFWDKIAEGVGKVVNKARGESLFDSDYRMGDEDDDYSDWDE